jgi:hypothetical protein
MKAFRLTVLASVCAAGYAAAAHAGIYMESVTRDKATGKEEPLQTMQIQNGMARIEANQRNTVIIFKNDTLFILDGAKKSYMAMDSAALERTMTAMNELMQRMQSQMANMPPEQRAAIENMMKQSGMGGAAAKPMVFDAVATGGNESVGGRGCKIWNLTRDTVPTSQVCVVSYATLPGKDEVQALAKKMGSMFEKLPPALRGQYSGNPLQQVNGVTSKINGVPFITRTYANGMLENKETKIKTWKEQAVAPSAFDIPSDYMKQELPAIQTRPM